MHVYGIYVKHTFLWNKTNSKKKKAQKEKKSNKKRGIEEKQN